MFFLCSFSVLAVSQKSEIEIENTIPMSTFSSGLYTFTYPETFNGIEEVSIAFTALRGMFDEVFRFDNLNLNTQCSVVILPDQAAYERYVLARIGEIRSHYVFLKYSKPELSELVLYPKTTEKLVSLSGYAAFSGPNLNRQLFLQYIYSHIAEPPIWIRDGFQSFFETAIWNVKTNKIEESNIYPWLETAKAAFSNPEQKISISSLLSAVTGTYEASRLYPQVWAFTTFCMSTERGDYQRFLHEIFIMLARDGRYNSSSLQENTDAVKNRFIRYFSLSDVEKDFALWLSEKYTYNDLIQFGVQLYNTGEYNSAKNRLKEARAIRPQDPLVSYYLGLVYFAEKDYVEAKKWYTEAGLLGAESASVQWALALNAWAQESFAESKKYLESAKTINPAKYGERADKLLKAMPK